VRSDVAIGIAVGGFLGAVMVFGNIQRADPHLVSTYPDLLSAALAPMLIYSVLRRRRAGSDRSDILRVGATISVAAAVIFSVVVAVFAWAWLPGPSFALTAFAAAGSFLLTIGFGYLASSLASRTPRTV